MSSEPLHAPLAPSSAARWRQCGRSPSLEAVYPEDTESEAAREGTAAHWYLAERLQGRDHPVGAIAENGVPVTAEMMDHVEPLVAEVMDRVRDVALRNGQTVEYVVANWLGIEQRVYMSGGVHKDNWGTCDVFLYDPAGRTIFVWDFKYGHGYVDHEGNWQIVDYGQGVAEHFGLAPGALALAGTVYQPRCYHRGPPLRTWTITGDEHRKLVDQLHMAAKLVSPNAAAVTGPECKNCRGIVPCQANQRMAGYVADVAMRTVDTPLDPSAMGGEYAMLLTAQERIKARITGLEEAIKANPTGTGWITEQGFGREKWSVPTEEVIALGDMLGVDVRKPQEALTPAQARKKGLDVEVSKAYTTIPKGEVKLVRQSSSAAARAFEQE
jgi:hypothetical protein